MMQWDDSLWALLAAMLAVVIIGVLVTISQYHG